MTDDERDASALTGAEFSVATAAALVAAPDHVPKPLFDTLNRQREVPAPATHADGPKSMSEAPFDSMKNYTLLATLDEPDSGGPGSDNTVLAAEPGEDPTPASAVQEEITNRVGRVSAPSSSRRNSSGASTAVPSDGAFCPVVFCLIATSFPYLFPGLDLPPSDVDSGAVDLAAASLAQIPSSSRERLDERREHGEERSGSAMARPQYAITGYDWSTFVAAYAAGRWNPARTPSAPRASAYSTPNTPGEVERDKPESGRLKRGSQLGSGMAPLSLPPPDLDSQKTDTSSTSGTGTSASDMSGSSRGALSSAPTSMHSSAHSDSAFAKEFMTPQPRPEASSATGSPISIAPQPASAPNASPTGLSQRRASLGSTYTHDSTMRIPLPPESAHAGSSNSPRLLNRSSLFSPSLGTPAHIQSFPSVLPTPSESSGQTFVHAMSAMPAGAKTPELAAAAAAMRWAASSHPSIAPLALPSPEHELMDPMRGVTVAVPMDSVEETDEERSSDAGLRDRMRGLGIQSGKTRGERKGRYLKGRTPSQTRRIWEKFTSEKYQSSSEETEMGRSDDDGLHLPSEPRRSRRREAMVDAPVAFASGSKLPTIEASPLGSPAERERPSTPPRESSSGSSSRGSGEVSRLTAIGHRSSSLPAPASAPLLRVASEEEGKSGPQAPATDYFGLAIRRESPKRVSPIPEASTSSETSPDRPSTRISPTSSDDSPEHELGSQMQSFSSLPSVNSVLAEAFSSPPAFEDPSASDDSLLAPLPPFPGVANASTSRSSLSLPNTPATRNLLSRQSSSPLPARRSSGEEVCIASESSHPASPALGAPQRAIDVISDSTGNASSSSARPHLQPHPLSHSQQPPSPQPPPPQPHTPARKTTTFDFHAHTRMGKSATEGSKSSSRPGLSRAQSMKAVGTASGSQRFAREEEEYARRGYLVPPFPMEELQRRRALYKYVFTILSCISWTSSGACVGSLKTSA